MQSPNESQVLEILRQVKLPAQRVSVVEANQVGAVDIKENSIVVQFRLPERNPMFEKSLAFQTEKLLKEKFPSVSVGIEFGAVKPAGKKTPRIGSIIAVGSGKGGVGKSSFTVNLAFAIKELGYKVGILDCDVYGPSIPTMLGVEGLKPFVVDGKIQPVESQGVQLMSAGFFVEEGQGLVWRGPMIHKLIQQFYGDVEWDGTDVLLVDLPPGTGDAPLSLSQTMPLTGAVLVSLPQKVSLIDVHKAVAMFQHLKVPIFGLVENMSRFVCPHCEETSEIFGKGGVRGLSEKLGLPYLGDVPVDPRIRELCDQGRIFVNEFPKTEAAQCFKALAERLQPVLRMAEDTHPVAGLA